MDNHRKYTLGEIYVFKFSEFNPNDFAKRHPPSDDDLFVVYSGENNGNPLVCIWGNNMFWHNSHDGWDVVLNVEAWFRIPKAKEIADGNEVNEEKV